MCGQLWIQSTTGSITTNPTARKLSLLWDPDPWWSQPLGQLTSGNAGSAQVIVGNDGPRVRIPEKAQFSFSLGCLLSRLLLAMALHSTSNNSLCR